MSSSIRKIPLAGSERSLLSGSSLIGSPDPNERIQVTILIHRTLSKEIADKVEQNSRQFPKDRRHMTQEEFSLKYACSTEDLTKIETFAHKHNLDVVKKNALHCTVVLSGTIDSFCKAFDIKLALYKHPEGIYRGRAGPVHIPQELSQIVQGIFGLDNRPQIRPHFRLLKEKHFEKLPTSHMSYDPNELATLYDFQIEFDGSGQSIAIIELGGGYSTADLQVYFEKLGIDMPKVLAVSVDDASNNPTGSPDGPDGEVMLDIEVAGSVAPGANIIVYFAPNTDIGFLDAINTAIHDTANKPLSSQLVGEVTNPAGQLRHKMPSIKFSKTHLHLASQSVQLRAITAHLMASVTATPIGFSCF